MFDFERMFGVRGGTGAFVLTQRHGRDVTVDAALGTQTSVTGVFGRGRITRLTELWYEQRLGRWGSLRFGRMPMGEDFAAFSSEFQILPLVGSQPGRIVGDYWYNWPVSQWGARLRAGSADAAYIQAGAFQVNPDNIENGFSFDFSRGRGTLLPVEAGWFPRIGAEGIQGSYKLGGWYSTTSAEDVFLNTGGLPLAVAGGPALRRRGQYGFYFVGIQELYRPDPGNKDRGLSAFLRGVAADRETTVFYRQITAGLVYRGLWAARPNDSLGIGVGQTSVNDRIAAATRLSNAAGRKTDPIPTAERFLEVFYSAAITPNVVVRPNIQFIHRPSGVTLRPDVLVLGLKSTIVF